MSLVKVNTDVSDNTGEVSLNSVIQKNKLYLTTPFKRTMIYTHSDEAVWGPLYNYSKYDLFCLKRNLEPIFSSLKLTFQIKSFQIDDVMNVCILPVKDGNFIEMDDSTRNKLQQEVDFVTNELHDIVLLYDPSINDKLFPTNWVLNVFPYLTVDTKYNPKYLNARLYIQIADNIDYDRIYEDQYNLIVNQLSDLYTHGAISCDNYFAKKWDLISYKQNLYIPTWKDERITLDTSLFLLNLNNNKFCVLNIYPDALLRHVIVKSINIKIVFNTKNNSILVYPNNINDIYDLLKVIELYKQNTVKYSIINKSIANITKFKEYCIKVKNVYPNSDCLYYNISNNNYPFLFSAVIYDVDTSMDQKLIDL